MKLVLDSYGSIWPPGKLNGLTTDIGEYSECLGIESPKLENYQTFNGKYCLMKIIIPFPELSALYNDESHLKNELISSSPIISTILYLNGAIHQMGICIPSQCSASEIEHLINASK